MSGVQTRDLPEDPPDHAPRESAEVIAIAFVVIYTLWTTLLLPLLFWVGWIGLNVTALYVVLTVILWAVTLELVRR